MWKTVLCKKCA